MPFQAIETKRLLIRDWKETDLEPFAVLNGDPDVMEFFPAILSAEQSNAMAAVIREKIDRNRYGFFAVELKETGKFIGFVGLNNPAAPLPFKPCVEIGWRLGKEAWGFGYATEAAATCLDFAFDNLSLVEVVSFTATINLKSQKVMQRLGFRQNKDEDFDHPDVPEGHPLRPHVLYRLSRDDWHKKSRSL
ncbi:GNAT family N-acetyltransferase [Sneathiella aquimaris]|uniref:GNAT family N-acetyltransferase n=1 Tax=Sneathiella aquimaris TaxID=2599305 RepID=UPI00146A2BDF|nr:GNAT family N-acetyltransferase [Sneathiella aquimaris]